MTEARAKPLTDSPWFWLLLFGSMAMAMSVAVQPRFARRYERLERMHQARVQVALRSNTLVGETPDGQGESPAEDSTLNSSGGSLAVLRYVLAGLIFLSALVLIVTRRRTETIR
ncbi:MAG TPA: hypothetical protein VGX76_09180 [Pirellulales bacterium]|nr:hypothetical protein [Pirellulales bacterium]